MRYNFGATDAQFIGVDLAWREGSADVVANETGVAVIDGDGQILDAGWTRGVEQTIAWADSTAGDGDAGMFAGAPLVFRNQTGQWLCETQAGQKYGPLEGQRQYDEYPFGAPGGHSVPADGRTVRLAIFRRQQRATARRPACLGTYPYATLAGAAELGYGTERPRYKRKPPCLPAAQRRAGRAANCDTLIRRFGQLADADPLLLKALLRELALSRDTAL